MCGICGIAIPENLNREVSEGLLIRMRDALKHRGPDGAGCYLNYGSGANIGLGHRRLSIVDIGGGSQPMCNEDSTVWITYNGEVYNHQELRPALEDAGHCYHSVCDTETIVHLYEQHGLDAVCRLRGMFAFAIWDAIERRLVLARDRLGVKPLYYCLLTDGTFFFASEIKALIEAGAVKPEINYDALSDYAANRGTSGEETLFRDVKRLLPGHTLVWKDGRVTIRPYWELSYDKDEDALSDRAYVSRFNELFDESVRLRLMADVPLGVFLSGGIDSSAIVSSMSRMAGDRISTFSVGFAEREANELEFARTVAEEFGTRHREVVLSPQQFFEALPQLVYQEDEPIAHASSVPLHFVSKLAAQHVKVVLTGEGSDEILAGYHKYPKTLYNLALGRGYRQITSAKQREAVAAWINRLSASAVRQKLARTFLCIEPRIDCIYFDNFAVFPSAMQPRMFTQEALEQMRERDPYRKLREFIAASDARSMLNQLLAVDVKTYLHELLMKQDQMSMSASIESRVPFLDHRLVEFVAKLPERMKLRGLVTKYILRRSMSGHLPSAILRRRKMGFPVPVGKWLRGAFRHVVDEYVLSERTLARRVFDAGFVNELVARHMSGENHSERLWALINFEIWQRRFFDGEAACQELSRNRPVSVGVGA